MLLIPLFLSYHVRLFLLQLWPLQQALNCLLSLVISLIPTAFVAIPPALRLVLPLGLQLPLVAALVRLLPVWERLPALLLPLLHLNPLTSNSRSHLSCSPVSSSWVAQLPSLPLLSPPLPRPFLAPPPPGASSLWPPCTIPVSFYSPLTPPAPSYSAHLSSLALQLLLTFRSPLISLLRSFFVLPIVLLARGLLLLLFLLILLLLRASGRIVLGLPGLPRLVVVGLGLLVRQPIS